ncbi:MAG: hypothetical protein M1826_003546 [Phylliscum demangeonii]|nr:MAG: hypothetical protein M1826_003546 [Phylliscum demangeonii]
MSSYLLHFLLALPLPLAFVSSITPPASPSPAASADDIICRPSGCYPRIFSPTIDFQPMHEDQLIPAGLHVRLNLQTGQREARLNVERSSGDGAPDAAWSSPTDDLVLRLADPDPAPDVEAVDEDDETRTQPMSAVAHPRSGQPPASSTHGRIVPPQDASEATVFRSSVETVLAYASSSSSSPSDADAHAEQQQVQDALEELETLAHELYYGVEIVKNAALVETGLLGLARHAPTNTIRALAVLVLASATANNPAAVEQWPPQGDTTVVGAIMHLIEAEPRPKVQERLLLLLSNVIRAAPHRHRFLRERGMPRLLANVFRPEQAGRDGRDAVRGRCAVLVADHFLDPDMGGGGGAPAAAAGDDDVGDDVGDDEASEVVALAVAIDRWCDAFGTSAEALRKAAAPRLLLLLPEEKEAATTARERIEAARAFARCTQHGEL